LLKISATKVGGPSLRRKILNVASGHGLYKGQNYIEI
jgi:hypothetical protein